MIESTWKIIQSIEHGFSVYMPSNAMERLTDHCFIVETPFQIPQFSVCISLDNMYDSEFAVFNSNSAKLELVDYIEDFFKLSERRDKLPDQVYSTNIDKDVETNGYSGKQITVMNGNNKQIYRLYRTSLGILIMRVSTLLNDNSPHINQFFESLRLTNG